MTALDQHPVMTCMVLGELMIHKLRTVPRAVLHLGQSLRI